VNSESAKGGIGWLPLIMRLVGFITTLLTSGLLFNVVVVGVGLGFPTCGGSIVAHLDNRDFLLNMLYV
jgi:hypothetical protein